MDSKTPAHYGRLVDETLTVPLCVTWMVNMPATEALAAVGGREESWGGRTCKETVQAANDALPMHPGVALAGALGEWTVLVEPNGFRPA
ncbi:hypothetical protein [Nonomuraea sp. NPDC050643]|uniref:hypothetical protein n=1 Tax=Nonomuraea sp. NPDC050643 TaxID=3155660 RepID=UPI00340BB815